MSSVGGGNVIDKNMHTTHLLSDNRHHLLDVPLVDDVALNSESRTSPVDTRDFLRNIRGEVSIEIRDCHGDAHFAKLQGDIFSYVTTCAGYYRDPSLS